MGRRLVTTRRHETQPEPGRPGQHPPVPEPVPASEPRRVEVREALAEVLASLDRTGLDPLELWVQATSGGPQVKLRFRRLRDLTAWCAAERVRVTHVDKTVPLRHHLHSALYSRRGCRVLAQALVWEWDEELGT